MMEYKGYVASVEYDDGANLLHGEIFCTVRSSIRGLSSLSKATSVDDLRREMEASVEDYLEWWEERGNKPK